jgi:hypothetical protein
MLDGNLAISKSSKVPKYVEFQLISKVIFAALKKTAM